MTGTARREDALVEAREVTREYRLKGDLIQAVRGISLEIQAGDFLAIVGPSGSGKSTLLHLLGAVDTPTDGTIYLDGTDVTSMSDPQRARFRLEHVGLVFQRFHLLPMLTATENVELPMAEAGVSRRDRRNRAVELLERVGLANRMRHRPGEISGGQRQRVAVARALANRPSLLLADEPTGELDQATSGEMLELFQSLNEDGTSIAVATHDLTLAAGARKRLTLVDGRIRE
ncbi:MAG: ABC transporter ATP-binding protein [Gemmatimonadetes bacterium]|nr:ABC transporter ATP-binding protein [Gemmatimonadota bacterium]NNK48933.1 ABC transporter ATP-binding protein [Gemmatimonadota bacterium]